MRMKQNNLMKNLSLKVIGGIVFGIAAIIGIAMTIAFTEPTAGPTGFSEPVNTDDKGDLRDLVGTSNSTTESATTLFNYLRKIDASPSAESEPSVGGDGFLQGLIGAASPASGDGSTLFKYMKKIDDVVGEDMFAKQSLATIDDRSAVYTAEEVGWEEVPSSPFTAAAAAIDYAGNNGETDLYSGTVKKDLRTGLWWTDRSSLTLSNSFADAIDGERPSGGHSIGFCNALNTYNAGAGFADHTNWYLPTQKELQQAYIDGSNHNLPSPDDLFWSSTEYYGNPDSAWRVTLYYGSTTHTTQTTASYVRCVRR